MEQSGAAVSDVLVVCPDGSVLLNPSVEDAGALHRHGRHAAARRSVRRGDRRCRPGRPGHRGLCGLRRLEAWWCSTARSYGGQAGASARIENYLGFPTGISGQALAGRAYVQAQKFGARDADPSAGGVARLHAPESRGRAVGRLWPTGGGLKARAVVAASGARYRRPAVPRLAEFEGRGVWYWASAIEARHVRAGRGGAGRRRQLGRAGGGVPGAARQHGSSCWCAAPGWPPACRAT